MGTSKYTIDDVREIFHRKGYTLLENEYKNNRTEMRFICPNHPEKESKITLSSLLNGRKCRECSPSKKLTIDDATKDFDQMGFILLEKKYLGASAKMKCVCKNHKNIIQYKKYSHIRNTKAGCKYCAADKKANNTRLKFIEVKKYFEGLGYELLENEYKNAQTKMKFRCLKHPNHIQEKKLNSLKNGERCLFCVRNFVTFEDIKEEFEIRGYELLETEYKPAHAKLKYRCPKHPMYTFRITRGNLKDGKGCPECGHDLHRGENNHRWRGGASSLNQYLRARVKQWAGEYRKDKTLKCFVTGSKKYLQIHHASPFYVIRDKVLEELDLPFLNHISKYTDEQLSAMTEKLKEFHEGVIGVALTEDIHKLFHHHYGYDVTTDDLYEFKERYWSGEFGKVEPKEEQLNLIL